MESRFDPGKRLSYPPHMANIHINRERQSLGQFPPEEVAAGLKSGRFLTSDLAWSEGMESWKPLGEYPNLPEVEEEVPILAQGVLPALPATDEPAWERRPTLAFFTALVQSVKEIISQPRTVFASMKPSGGFQNPLTFYVIVGTLSGIVSIFYQFATTLIDPSSLGKGSEHLTPVVLTGMFVAFIVILPILMTLGSFIGAGILHLCLMLVGGATKPFEVTFRTYCYATGAALVFQFVPLCGGFIASIYGLVLTVIGLQKTHGIDTGKAVIAVLLPLVICCGILVVVLALGGAGLVTALETFGKAQAR